MSDTSGMGPRLARWAAEARADEAVAARSRERWLRQQASETATLAGTLIDLAERNEPVAVTVAGGRTHRGAIDAVGADVVTLIDTNGRRVYVATASVEAIEFTDTAEPASDRGGDSEVSMVDVVAGLAADRAAVTVTTREQSWTATLTGAGADILTLRLDTPDHRVVLVPLAAVVDVIG